MSATSPSTERLARTMLDELRKTKRGNRLYIQERTILDMTELLSREMVNQGVTSSELGRRMNKSAEYIDRLLGGDIGMTVRTLADADAFAALGKRLSFAVYDEDTATANDASKNSGKGS
jgi:hypothetical protein